jgi:hypothetical protein
MRRTNLADGTLVFEARQSICAGLGPRFATAPRLGLYNAGLNWRANLRPFERSGIPLGGTLAEPAAGAEIDSWTPPSVQHHHIPTVPHTEAVSRDLRSTRIRLPAMRPLTVR